MFVSKPTLLTEDVGTVQAHEPISQRVKRMSMCVYHGLCCEMHTVLCIRTSSLCIRTMCWCCGSLWLPFPDPAFGPRARRREPPGFPPERALSWQGEAAILVVYSRHSSVRVPPAGGDVGNFPLAGSPAPPGTRLEPPGRERGRERVLWPLGEGTVLLDLKLFGRAATHSAAPPPSRLSGKCGKVRTTSPLPLLVFISLYLSGQINPGCPSILCVRVLPS